MRQFKDGQDRTWDVTVTVATLRRVRNELQGPDGTRFELMDLASVGSPAFQRVMEDPIELCDVLYAVCLPQAKERGLDADRFGELLAGDVLREATNALLGSIADFSPSPAIRAALGREMNALMEATERVHRKIGEAMDETTLTTAIEEAYEASLRQGATTGTPASERPGSSESSRGDTPSASSS